MSLFKRLAPTDKNQDWSHKWVCLHCAIHIVQWKRNLSLFSGLQCLAHCSLPLCHFIYVCRNKYMLPLFWANLLNNPDKWTEDSWKCKPCQSNLLHSSSVLLLFYCCLFCSCCCCCCCWQTDWGQCPRFQSCSIIRGEIVMIICPPFVSQPCETNTKSWRISTNIW